MSYVNYFKQQFGHNFLIVDRNYLKSFFAQHRFLKKHISIEPRHSIIEIGSGLGSFTKFLDIDQNYLGIELDGDAVSFANKENPNFKFIKSSVEQLPDDGLRYDYVLAFEVLEHVENPSAAILKCFQLLKNGGKFVGTSPFPFKKNVLADPTHLHVMHPLNWKTLFENQGFTVEKIVPMTYMPFIWRVKKEWNFRLPFYVRLPGFVSTCLIVAQKKC